MILSLLALIFAMGTWMFPYGEYFDFYKNFLRSLVIFYFIVDFYLVNYEYKKALQELIDKGIKQ